MSAVLISIARSLLPLLLGYALARLAGLPADALRILLRYAVVPIVLFSSLLGPLPGRNLVLVALAGVAMVQAAFWLARLIRGRSALGLGNAAATPGMLVLALPFLALSVGARSGTLAMAAVAFVACGLALIFSEHGERGFSVLIREPWPYAVLAALLVSLLGLPTAEAWRVLSPLADGAWMLLLVSLGASLHPLAVRSQLAAPAAWAEAGLRLGVGLLVALPFIFFAGLSNHAEQALVALALAPAVAAPVSLFHGAGPARGGRAPEAPAGQAASVLLSVLAFAVWQLVFLTSWK